MKCECGGEFIDSNWKGLGFPWKHYKNIVLTEDFIGKKCPNCNEVAIKGGDCKLLDELLQISLDNSTKS